MQNSVIVNQTSASSLSANSKMNTSISQIKDSSSPYYIHYSEHHGSVMVTPKLTVTNYLTWRRSFLIAVSIRNKQGFLDGSIPKLDSTDSMFLSWTRYNNLLIA